MLRTAWAVESLSLGPLAADLGSAAALGIAWVLGEYVMAVPFQPVWPVYGMALFGGPLLIGLIEMSAGLRSAAAGAVGALEALGLGGYYFRDWQP